ncbi:MAG: 2-amino-4-hydroxy-6-hydroxymethyldihydropteridine diphosphokinase [Thaumarchaeota archaeon]|nr:2-amino-4-hydroxy-6-hydroxymethyldihydropteridine diphosphokinase [Nitrososphaerota archaeon]
MVEVIVALGSNVGDRKQNLDRAVTQIDGLGRVLDASSIYETEPMYYEKQGPFLNAVIALETSLSPTELLVRLKAIEKAMGRDSTAPRYGPRVIDLDILFYGDTVLSESDLQIPHPHIAERAFVLVPLEEIRPGLVDPGSGRTVREMLARLNSKGAVVRRSTFDRGNASSEPQRS